MRLIRIQRWYQKSVMHIFDAVHAFRAVLLALRRIEAGIRLPFGGQGVAPRSKTREINLSQQSGYVRRRMNFPVSIKGVLVEAGCVVLLENERDDCGRSCRPIPAT